MVSVALTACKAGQERNPETNRCRSVLAATTLEPCNEGQERNLDTNRCRKLSSSSAATDQLATVTDIASPISSFGPGWWVASGVALLALGYAGYEWRHDLLSKMTSLKSRFSK